jgi:hypothetical protein
MARQRVPFAVRFWQRVDVAGQEECWLWTGAPLPGGYGRINLGGKGSDYTLAHRASWEINHGPIPVGIMVCHACDNRLCVNPSHLFLGTHQENMADGRAKSRFASGERQHLAKLTRDSVGEIRRLYRLGVVQVQLAERFGVSQSQISSIVRRNVWREVD